MGDVVKTGDAVLYHGDCLEILPTLGKVDAVVTDPPYGIGERMSGGTWGAAEKYAEFRRWDVAPSTDFFTTLIEMARDVIVWGGNYFALPPSRCWLSWCKSNAVPTMADFELAWTNLDQPCKRFVGGVGRHEHGHPTQKPIELMAWCVERVPAARTILDPFMGSGTTLVACQRMGRAGTGIELDPDYFEIACRRVDEASSQPDLFIAPKPEAPKQETLL